MKFARKRNQRILRAYSEKRRVIHNADSLFIDVFDTFVESEEDLFQARLRKGFLDFLKVHYRSGKRIVAHSDAIEDRNFRNYLEVCGVGQYVTSTFGKDYLFRDKDVKDFARMARVIKVPLNKIVVIAEEFSADTLASLIAGVRVVEVPRMSLDGRFNFKYLA